MAPNKLHLILTLYVNWTQTDASGAERKGKLNITDASGAERKGKLNITDASGAERKGKLNIVDLAGDARPTEDPRRTGAYRTQSGAASKY
ncbi:hypothetical protein T484DRAFT_1834302 [Baffinella frigidus]|nr:hypothetical protein T484DRAFT_1834302 [Cryptophyta sp. CCMP2293]